MIIRYILIGLLLVLGFLTLSTYSLYRECKFLENELSVSVSNEKAFINENSKLKENNRLFKFTIEQLSYYNDSILKSMDSIRTKLKIKDSELKQMQYLLTTSTKADTIIFKDIIFKEPTTNIDTVIKDKWYSIKLGLSYPSNIYVEPCFTSEKYIIINSKKETVKPPKKCWLLRVFQKKHNIVEINIIENSPYIKTNQQKFIEIIQ